MNTSNQITPGMTLSIDGKIYRVLSSVKVTVAKGIPFIKTRLKNIAEEEVIEKNFKLNQSVEEVILTEKQLEFLYPDGENYLFLDISTLDQVLVPMRVVGEKMRYLKEGVEIKALFYGKVLFSIELPSFLELMVTKTESKEGEKDAMVNATKMATLETGATLEVPPFVEPGDVVRLDGETKQYIQRV